jgi:Flp pilus assembly protein TadD
MDETLSSRAISRTPWAVALLALLLFGCTSSNLPVPEASVSFLADALRLSPFPSMDRPLWGWLIRLWAGPVPGSAVLVAHGLSVVLGACGAGLLARLVEGSLVDRRIRSGTTLAPLAGAIAGLALATSIPYWLVSNRAHPAPLGLVLLLIALNLLQHYRLTGSPRGLWLGTAVYAVGMAELPTLLLLAPVIAGQTLLVLWQKRELRVVRVLLLTFVLLLTPLLWWLAALDYARLPAAAWREMSGPAEALHYELITYRDILLRSAPKQGWLILLFTTLLPWLVAYVTMRTTPSPIPRGGPILLYLLVVALVVAVLLNAPMSPWALLGFRPLLVMPYVLLASALAYLLVLGASMAMTWLPFKRGVVAGTGLLAALVVAGMGVRGAPEVSTRSAAPVTRLARLTLDHAGARDVLVAHDLMSDHLRLLLFQTGGKLTLLDAAFSELSGYRRYMASLFKDPRQQSLALAGLGPVLVDWLATDTSVVERLVVQTTPDIWLSEGYQPLPLGNLYAGVRTVSEQDIERVRAVSETYWVQVREATRALLADTPRLAPLARALAAQAARVANDTGVFFEHHGRRDLARTAYAEARQLDPDNVSAAANLVVLGQASGWSGIDVEEADLALAVAPRDVALGLVVNRYGHLRRREAAQLLGGWGGGMEGPVGEDPAWSAVVQAYRQGDRSEARRRVEKILAERPEFDPAWILLAHLAYEQGDEEALQKCVRKMREVRREWPEIAVLLGRQALDRQDLAAARDFFERAALLRPAEMNIHELLLNLDLRERNFARAESRARQMLSLQPASVSGLIGLGAVLRFNERLDLAEHTLNRVLEVQRHPQALAELALLQAEQGHVESARTLAEEAVTRGPRLPATHEAMGVVLRRQGDYPAALDSFRRAQTLDGQRWSTRVYLAEALYRTGQDTSAREQVRALRKERHGKDREMDAVLAGLPQ